MHRLPLQEHLEGRAASDKDWFSLHCTSPADTRGLASVNDMNETDVAVVGGRALSRRLART